MAPFIIPKTFYRHSLVEKHALDLLVYVFGSQHSVIYHFNSHIATLWQALWHTLPILMVAKTFSDIFLLKIMHQIYWFMFLQATPNVIYHFNSRHCSTLLLALWHPMTPLIILVFFQAFHDKNMIFIQCFIFSQLNTFAIHHDISYNPATLWLALWQSLPPHHYF